MRRSNLSSDKQRHKKVPLSVSLSSTLPTIESADEISKFLTTEEVIEEPFPARQLSSTQEIQKQRVDNSNVPLAPKKNTSNIKLTHSHDKLNKYAQRSSSEKVLTSRESLYDYDESRRSQWEILMRKFSNDCKLRDSCRSFPTISPTEWHKEKFSTGSTYEGFWNTLGMNGHGTYKFSTGVVYIGQFEDNAFHGDGELRYPDGLRIRGHWQKGILQAKSLIFSDGTDYDDKDWDYCNSYDRRFSNERVSNLMPAGKSNLTNDQPTKEIPYGFYDAGDGFYDPVTKSVYKYDDLTVIVSKMGNRKKRYYKLISKTRFKKKIKLQRKLIMNRSQSEAEHRWVTEHYRSNIDGSVGPRQDLYEEWMDPARRIERSSEDNRESSLIEDFIFNPQAWASMSECRRPLIKFDSNFVLADNDDKIK